MKYRMKHAPMGWNSYDYYDTTVTEREVRANADYMAAHLKPYGWEYIVVDIQWYAKNTGSQREKYQYIPFGEVSMDEYGRLLPCTDRFPSAKDGVGFRALADYVHGLGLKFGIHIMRGIPREAAHRHLPILGSDALASDIADPSSICKWNPDMYGIRMGEPGAQEYYDSIVALYAQWGVDFIKCDDICNTNLYVEHPYSAAHEIEMLQHAIEKCGRDIVLSLSPGPALIEKAWHYETYANMWRITDDFWDTWELLYDMFRRCELWQNHVGCGSFPDCDMLLVGWLGKGFGQERQTNFTRDEQKTMMTLWCMFGSPLMIGGELTKLDDWTQFLLTRRELLQMLDADYVGRQVARDQKHAVWSCVNEKKDERYLALFNFMEQPARCEVALPETEAFADMCGQTGTIRARELWDGTELIVQNDSLSSEIPAHGVHVFRIDKK